mgnify:FL=1
MSAGRSTQNSRGRVIPFDREEREAHKEGDEILRRHTERRTKKVRRPKRRRRLIAALVIIGLLGALAAVIWFTRITEITIEGNDFYSDEDITEIIFSEEKDYITAYRWYDEHFNDQPQIPFVSSYRMLFDGPHKVRVIVYEKSIIGCIEYLNTYLYFDNDGTIVESSTDRRGEVVLVTGLDFSQVVLYRRLPVGDDRIFDDILSVSQLLEVYGIHADSLEIDDDGSITLVLADTEGAGGSLLQLNGVTVFLGGGEYIQEKMNVLSDMLASLSGMSGTLYLDGYDPALPGHGYIMDTD